MKDANFGTRLSVRLLKGTRLIGGPLKRGFTVLKIGKSVSLDYIQEISGGPGSYETPS